MIDPNRGSGRLLPKMPLPAHVRRLADDGYMPPLDDVAAEINIRLQLAAKADDHRIAAGKLLIEARQRVESGEAGDITWSDWVKQHIDRSPGDVRKVMALARAGDPLTARGQEKERAQQGMARLRHERANVSALPQLCADETAEDLPGEILAQWGRLSSSNRGDLLRQLWLALPLTEQSEFLSWLAPRTKAWSIQPEPGRSPEGASKAPGLAPPSSPAEDEEPAETALHPPLPVTGEQGDQIPHAAEGPTAAVLWLAGREAAGVTDARTPAAQPADTETSTSQELMAIYNGLKPNTKKWAVYWIEHGCGEPEKTEPISITEGLLPFRDAAQNASADERERFLALCQTDEGAPESGEQADQISRPAAEVSHAYQSAA
jgi:hypothetical protein